MKNLITAFILAICLFIGTTSTNACEWQLEKPVNPTEIVIVTEKVESVFFENGWYYLTTKVDNKGGRWVLEVEKAKNQDTKKLAKLKQQYIGKMVDVQYTGDYEYLSWYTLE